MSECGRATAIVASHLAELGDQLAADPGTSFLRFDVQLSDGRLVFDYRVRPGISNARIGMHILAGEGIVAGLQRLREMGINGQPSATSLSPSVLQE